MSCYGLKCNVKKWKSDVGKIIPSPDSRLTQRAEELFHLAHQPQKRLQELEPKIFHLFVRNLSKFSIPKPQGGCWIMAIKYLLQREVLPT